MSDSEYIINPRTKRKIKVGSRTYKQLLKAGKIFDEEKPVKKSKKDAKPSKKSKKAADDDDDLEDF